MAIYHCSVKPVQRSAGRSATAAAAYRAGCVIDCEREGRTHDYTRKGGIVGSGIVGADMTRADLWNAAEKAEKRKDGTPAREFEVALPAELTRAQQLDLCRDIATALTRDGGAADWAMHDKRDGNPHAHIMRTTRHIDGETLGAKLDTEKAGRNRRDDLAQVRQLVADRINAHLERAGLDERVDHRSHKDRGIEDAPTVHLGPVVSDMIKKGKTPEVIERIGEQMRDASLAPSAADIDAASTELDALKELERETVALRELRQAQRDMRDIAAAERDRSDDIDDDRSDRDDRRRSYGHDR